MDIADSSCGQMSPPWSHDVVWRQGVCSDAEVAVGRWVPGTPPWLYRRIISYRTGGRAPVEVRTRKNASHCKNAKWIWQPEGCVLYAWNASDLCRLLHRGLLIVGDSSSAQMYHSVWAMLTHDLTNATSLLSNADYAPVTTTLCGGSTVLTFVRNDHLTLHSIEHGHTLFHRWEQKISLHDVVIINAGAHVQRTEVHVGNLVGALNTTARQARAGTAIFWRDTVPGAPNCKPHEHNLTLFDAEQRVRAYPYFGWARIRRNDLSVRKAITASPELRAHVHVLPAYQTSFQRFDAHVSYTDCLHFCLPGPTDSWVHLLYHLLLSAELRVAAQSLNSSLELEPNTGASPSQSLISSTTLNPNPSFTPARLLAFAVALGLIAQLRIWLGATRTQQHRRALRTRSVYQ